MKKDKKKVKEAFFDALLEIVLTLIFFGVGALIVSAFGVDFDTLNTEFDWVILLGCAVFLVLFLLVYAFIQWLKRTRR
jgi:hypothetical protein